MFHHFFIDDSFVFACSSTLMAAKMASNYQVYSLLYVASGRWIPGLLAMSPVHSAQTM